MIQGEFNFRSRKQANLLWVGVLKITLALAFLDEKGKYCQLGKPPEAENFSYSV